MHFCCTFLRFFVFYVFTFLVSAVHRIDVLLQILHFAADLSEKDCVLILSVISGSNASFPISDASLVSSCQCRLCDFVLLVMVAHIHSSFAMQAQYVWNRDTQRVVRSPVSATELPKLSAIDVPVTW